MKVEIGITIEENAKRGSVSQSLSTSWYAHKFKHEEDLKG